MRVFHDKNIVRVIFIDLDVENEKTEGVLMMRFFGQTKDGFLGYEWEGSQVSEEGMTSIYDGVIWSN